MTVDLDAPAPADTREQVMKLTPGQLWNESLHWRREARYWMHVALHDPRTEVALAAVQHGRSALTAARRCEDQAVSAVVEEIHSRHPGA
jgi:hypothetical protein